MPRILLPLCARCGHMGSLHTPGVKRGHSGKCIVFRPTKRTNSQGVEMIVPGTCECEEYQPKEGG